MKKTLLVLCLLTRLAWAGDFSFIDSELKGGKAAQLPAKSELTFIFYFASWCGFCEKAAPSVQSTYAKIKTCPIRFMGVSGDETLAAVNEVKAKWSFDFPVIHDQDRAWFRYLKIRQIPRAVLISKSEQRLVDGHGSDSVIKALGQIESWAKASKCYKK